MMFQCTGTIISEHHILTAAHCLEDASYSVEIQTRDENQSLLHSYNWTSHPGYTRYRKEHGIGIIKLATPTTIPPVPLAANYSHPKNDWLRVAGYGDTKFKIINGLVDPSEPAQTLMETYLHGFSKKDCPHLTARFPKVNGICMFRNDSTVLPGDSGGPVFAQGKDGQFYQVGFNTFTFYGLPYQSLATEISHYCPWIEEVTGREVKCQTFKPTPIVPPF